MAWKLSLRTRLVAVITTVALIALITFGAIGYRAATRAMERALTVRLQAVADQFARLSGPSTSDRMRQMREAAAAPSILAALQDPAGKATDTARAILIRLGPDTGAVVATELLKPDGTVVIPGAAPGPTAPALSPTEATATPFFVVDKSIYLAYSAPVLVNGTLQGFVYQVRRLVASPTLPAQLSLLIGPEALMLLGNTDGSFWTDLTRQIQRPPPKKEGAAYVRAGVARLAGSAPLPGTPITIAIEMPRSAALVEAGHLRRTFLLLGALVMGVAILTGGLAARTVNRPLGALSEATEQLANNAGPVGGLPIHRSDEIGSLARSFSVMAKQVREGRENLESQVAARTAELSVTLDQLHDAQDELVRKERLAILGQLAGSVGHELRNPLGVMTNAVFFLEATQKDAPEKVKEYLGILRGQIRLSEKIVADLLDFARIKTPERSTVDLKGFVDEQLQRANLAPSIEVVRQFEATGPVVADPVQIGQVLFNLLSNAAQAMEGGEGTLTVRTARFDGHVRISVSDTGPGVPAENLAKIFEPLFTTKARGIGLGLAVSRALSRANGGDLTVQSGTELGATFMLDLPVAV